MGNEHQRFPWAYLDILWRGEEGHDCKVSRSHLSSNLFKKGIGYIYVQ
jgi:hypothetical protein